jgi:multidrug efflux pump subunit AcrA (membrane-fusion protein)
MWALFFVLAIGGIGWWSYILGLESAGFNRQQAEIELAQRRDQAEKHLVEIVQLSSEVASFERQVQMERATNAELMTQVKNANEENVRLNEDLTLFQTLTVPGTRDGKLTIQYFKVERDTLPDEYRYRLFLVQGGQKRMPAFQGKFQLLVNIRQGDSQSVLIFPHENLPTVVEERKVDGVERPLDNTVYQLNFKYYKRIERSFRIQPDALIESVEVRIYEQGVHEPKIKRSVTLS